MEESRQLQSEAEKAALIPQVVEEKKMKVMVAVDESDVSLYALKWALDYLFVNSSYAAGGGGGGATSMAPPSEQPNREEETTGHRVTIVHVMQPFHQFVFPAGPFFSASTAVYATNSVVESVRKAQEENAASVISRALQTCKKKMIKAETIILEGDPKDMICEAAGKMNIDLVVVGSRGLGTIKRAFLGSVSDYCVHHAKCPILVVKPPKEPHK